MDMQFFRHNHARFIAVDVVSPVFLSQEETTFNFNEFKRQVTSNWTFENGEEKKNALKMVSEMNKEVFEFYCLVRSRPCFRFCSSGCSCSSQRQSILSSQNRSLYNPLPFNYPWTHTLSLRAKACRTIKEHGNILYI